MDLNKLTGELALNVSSLASPEASGSKFSDSGSKFYGYRLASPEASGSKFSLL